MNQNDVPAKAVNQPLITSAAGGVAWSANGPNEPCFFARIHNATGTTIEYRRNAGGNSVRVPDGAVRTVYGVNNLNQIQVRRFDQSVTQVTVDLEACS